MVKPNNFLYYWRCHYPLYCGTRPQQLSEPSIGHHGRRKDFDRLSYQQIFYEIK
jgi:hypothetical protein